MAGPAIARLDHGKVYLLSIWTEPAIRVSGIGRSYSEEDRIRALGDLAGVDLTILHCISEPDRAFDSLRGKYQSDPCLAISLALDAEGVVAKSLRADQGVQTDSLYLIDISGQIVWAGQWIAEAAIAYSAVKRGDFNREAMASRSAEYRRRSSELRDARDVESLNAKTRALNTEFAEWSNITVMLRLHRAAEILSAKASTDKSTAFSDLASEAIRSSAGKDRLVIEELLSHPVIAFLNDSRWPEVRREAAQRLVELDHSCDYRSLAVLASTCAEVKEWDAAIKHQTIAVGLAESRAVSELPKMKEDLVRYQHRGAAEHSPLLKDLK